MKYKTERARLRLSKKQKQIMKIICEGNKDDSGATVSWVDQEQLIDRLDYTPTRQAMVFSVRYLRQKGYIDEPATEIRRGRRRAILIPTELGFSMMNPTKSLEAYMNEEIIETY